MAADTGPKYINQVLEERYIKIKVLEDYLNNNAEAFGPDRSIQGERDSKITLVALRELTQDEILAIQKKSYPRQFSQLDDPFDLS